MINTQNDVKKIQLHYLQNVEKMKQGLKPEKKSWKPKDAELLRKSAMEKQRKPTKTSQQQTPPPPQQQASKASRQRLSRDLTCSICLDLFKKPVSLPCDHTFCKGCIAGYWAGPRSTGPGGTGSCPQCRKVSPGLSYRPNRIVANIVESYCQGLEEEKGTGEEKDDVRVAPPPPPPVPRCLRHREELKLYCEEDQELVCLVCAISQGHRSHNLLCVQEAEQQYKVSLNSSIDSLKTELDTAMRCDEEAEEEAQKLKEHTADLKQRIEAQFSDLHQFLYQEEKLLQVKLKTEERRELIRLDEHKALLCVEISRLQGALHEVEAQLQEQDPFALLRGIKTLLQRPHVKFERPVLTPHSLCEGRFAGPLQYRVWKSLKGSLYPVPAAITFNASTANPWLSLTSSLTCVRYQTFNRAIQDNPHRFNAALSLLGSQGFTHGRHYWEVEVHSSAVWTVGVARESVDRKGVIKALPANGFWTLSLSYGVQYMAGTSPPSVLALEEPLARVAVYLDYKRGLVSFYNAESMTHLYTFRERFAETLYPYFNLGFLDKVHENEPLKVFVPKI
ncbi:E3 ubiquitin-protein ligase TRIM69 [Gadus chalcogrammus]|uniref:E3 ubiquitin-protein ligase TRIM69 n=1 Tax=Gadus chalcogrammus TaxID=1042646 RepID=UPI0024C345FF|nr:E3 ubiquitin-protein ligase TRIM69 [Gadus chalcogrammus]